MGPMTPSRFPPEDGAITVKRAWMPELYVRNDHVLTMGFQRETPIGKKEKKGKKTGLYRANNMHL